jgi:hypothetical protein
MPGQYVEINGIIPEATVLEELDVQVPTNTTASVTIPAGIPAAPVETTGSRVPEVVVQPGVEASAANGLTLCIAFC